MAEASWECRAALVRRLFGTWMMRPPSAMTSGSSGERSMRRLLLPLRSGTCSWPRPPGERHYASFVARATRRPRKLPSTVLAKEAPFCKRQRRFSHPPSVPLSRLLHHNGYSSHTNPDPSVSQEEAAS